MYKGLLDIEIKPISSNEQLEELYDTCKESGITPIFPTHIAVRRGKIIGCLSTHSPSVHWWMKPNEVTTKESLFIFQGCDTLMADKGYDRYLIPCEPESPFFRLLTRRLETLKTPEGGDDFKLFLNKTGE